MERADLMGLPVYARVPSSQDRKRAACVTRVGRRVHRSAEIGSLSREGQLRHVKIVHAAGLRRTISGSPSGAGLACSSSGTPSRISARICRDLNRARPVRPTPPPTPNARSPLVELFSGIQRARASRFHYLGHVARSCRISRPK